MRRAIFIFITALVVAVGIDWTDSCTEEKTDKEKFAYKLSCANMYEYKDPDYDFTIRYPGFFSEQPDSLDEYTGYVRFSFADLWVNVVLEGYVMNNQGQNVQAAADSLGQVLHATYMKQGKDNFILSGPLYENDSYLKGYSFYSKYVLNSKLWFVYSMVYPDDYRDILGRLFHEIDEWQIWERPRLKLKQGESQVPRK